MASKTYKGTYNYDTLKNVDWGGDSTTGNLPLDGSYIQKIVKDTFKGKVGCIKTIGDQVCAFASEEDYDKYQAYVEAGNQEAADALILNSWQGIRPNSIQVDMINPTGTTQSYLYGADSMPITFKFDTVDQNYQHTIEETATIDITVKKGLSVIGTVKKTIKQNVETSIDLKQYLGESIGNNDVILSVVGDTSEASYSKTFTFAVIQLTFVDEFDISTPYNPTEHETMEVPFSVTAPAASVTVEFIVDGDTSTKTTVGLNSPAGNKQTQNISIAGLSEGIHSLQMTAQCMVGADVYSTDIHYREFAVVTSTEAVPYILLSNTIPVELGSTIDYILPTDDIVIYNVQQYAALSLNYAVYQHNIEKTKVGIYLDSTQQGGFQEVGNNSVQLYKIYPETSGNKVLRIDAYLQDNTTLSTSRTIKIDVADANLNVEPITDNLVLNLRARGKTNDAEDKAVWVDTTHNITGTLDGFTWSDTSGWDTSTNTLVVGIGNTVDINYSPFASRDDILNYGLTFILEFTTENVANDDTIVCDMRNSDGIGFCVTASEIYYMFTEGQKAVAVKFKSGELYRVALVFEAKNSDNKSLIKLYVNGIISAVYNYNYESLKGINKTISFVGSKTAEIRIKEIKIYKTALVSDQLVNDYILSRDNLYDTRDSYGNLVDKGMIDLYNANNIYEEGSVYSDLGIVNYDTEAIADKIPIIFLTGRGDKETEPYHDTTTTYKSIHDLEGNNKSKDPYIFVDVYYVNTQHPELNFYAERARLKIQGTSSVNYQKKNYKLSTNRTKYGTLVWQGVDCLDSTKRGDPKGKGNISFKKAWEDGDSETDPGVALKGEKPPKAVHTFVLKADCSDSSSAHNTGVARFWDRLFKTFTIATANGNEKMGQTKSQKWAEESNYAYDVRTCVDGYPTVMFWREDESSQYEFIGKYNFNNDKGDEDVYGYEFDDSPYYDSREQSWELLSSSDKFALGTADMSTFDDYTEAADHTVAYNWMEGFESRYPEQPDNVIDTTGVNLIKQFVDNGGTTELKSFYTWLSSTRYDASATTTNYGTLPTLTINAIKYSEKNGTYANTATNRKLKFHYEKWDHFDIYKMAAYYVYLMRFGAVDQVVKNAIFSTDGNEWNDENKPCQWYYRNYDNDTVLGSRNDGRLAYDPYIERKSASAEEGDDSQAFAYAGDTSVIWNQLTDDEEFMGYVKNVDNALVEAGLTYSQAIYFFNTLQSEKWCERIYNRDQIYKYISPFYSGTTKTNVDFPLLQGARMSHRKWWISKRFALYDSLYASGDYANSVIQFKCNDALKNDKNSVTNKQLVPYLTIEVTPGSNVYYGYMVHQAGGDKSWLGIKGYDNDNNPQPFTIKLSSIDYITVGNYVNILAADSIAELDLSLAIHRMSTLGLQQVYHSSRGTQLKTLKLGNTEKALELKNSDNPEDNAQYDAYISIETALTSIEVDKAIMLEYLDIYGLQYVVDIKLDALKFLQTFRAWASGLVSLSFADGCPLTYVEIPASMTALNLSGLNLLKSSGIKFENETTKIGALTIKNSQYLNTDYQFVFDWYNNKTVDDKDCRLTLEGLTWTLSKSGLVDNFIKLFNISDLNLKGIITVDRLSQAQYSAIVSYFGTTDVFDFTKNTELKIRLTNASIFININETAYEGNTLIIKPAIVSNSGVNLLSTVYNFYNGGATNSYGDTLSTESDGLNGKLVLNEKNTARHISCVAQVNLEDEDGKQNSITSLFELDVNKRIYPTTASIVVNTNTAFTDSSKTYYFTSNINPNVTDESSKGNFTYKWELLNVTDGGDFITYATFTSVADTSACAVQISDVHESRGKIRLTIDYVPTNTEVEIPPMQLVKEVDLIIKDPNSVVSIYENPVVFNIFKNSSAIETDDTRMTRVQASKVTNEQLATLFKGNTAVTEFNQLPYFTSITEIGDSCFSGCTSLTSITFVSQFESGLNEQIRAIGSHAFDGCIGLTELTIPKTVQSIGSYAFANCTNLKTLTFTPGYTGIELMSLGSYACYNCTSLESFTIGKNLSNTIDDGQTEGRWGSHVCDGCTGLTGYTFDNGIIATAIPAYTFYKCSSLKEINIDGNIEEIGEDAFGYCRAVTEINIPDTVTTIDSKAFEYCGDDSEGHGDYITTLTMGTGITSCAANAFNMVYPKEIYFNDGYQLKDSAGYLRIKDIYVGGWSSDTDIVTLNITSTMCNLNNTCTDSNRYQYVVRDNDFTTETITDATIKNGCFSLNGSLYYRASNTSDLYLLRYNYIKENSDYSLYDNGENKIIAYSGSCTYFTADNVILSENLDLRTVASGAHVSGTFELQTSMNNASSFFSNSKIGKIILASNETSLPTKFLNNLTLLDDDKSIIVPDTVSSIGTLIYNGSDDLSLIFTGKCEPLTLTLTSLYKNTYIPPTNLTIYVQADDYKYYYDIFKAACPLYPNLMKLISLPTEGYINIISKNDWIDSANTVTVGGSSAQLMYDGSWKYNTETENSDLSVILNGTEIGEVKDITNGYSEYFINSNSSDIIDFMLPRESSAYDAGYTCDAYTIAANTGWTYNQAFGLKTLYTVTGDIRGHKGTYTLTIVLGDSFKNSKIKIDGYLNVNNGANDFSDTITISVNGTSVFGATSNNRSTGSTGTYVNSTSTISINNITSTNIWKTTTPGIIEIGDNTTIRIVLYCNENTANDSATYNSSSVYGFWIKKIYKVDDEGNAISSTFEYPEMPICSVDSDNVISTKSEGISVAVTNDDNNGAYIVSKTPSTGTYADTEVEYDTLATVYDYIPLTGEYVSHSLNDESTIAYGYDGEMTEVALDATKNILAQTVETYNNRFEH